MKMLNYFLRKIIKFKIKNLKKMFILIKSWKNYILSLLLSFPKIFISRKINTNRECDFNELRKKCKNYIFYDDRILFS